MTRRPTKKAAKKATVHGRTRGSPLAPTAKIDAWKHKGQAKGQGMGGRVTARGGKY
jgi:hypothetical protein